MGIQTGGQRVTLSPKVVREVLWFLGDTNRGQEPGGFFSTLLLAVSRADVVNRAKLQNEYPEHVTALVIAQTTPWGLDWLRGLAQAAEREQLDLIGADRG